PLFSLSGPGPVRVEPGHEGPGGGLPIPRGQDGVSWNRGGESRSPTACVSTTRAPEMATSEAGELARHRGEFATCRTDVARLPNWRGGERCCGLAKHALVDDRVALKDAPRPVPGHLHRRRLRDARPDQVPRRRPPEVVKELRGDLARLLLLALFR